MITYDMDWPNEVVVYIDDLDEKSYFHKGCWKKYNASHPSSIFYRKPSENKYNTV
ncbi:MAG: hypothetical protein KKF54_07315 [Candidatus Omnitrophica bacterium]|nr:hypothetical protein [Candidatus Omnitrophota bacterium]